MDAAVVRDRVRAVIMDLAPLRATEVDADTSLRLDLGYDSLGLLELAGVLEAEFGLEAGDDDYDVDTVHDVEQVVLAKSGASRAEEAGAGWQSSAS